MKSTAMVWCVSVIGLVGLAAAGIVLWSQGQPAGTVASDSPNLLDVPRHPVTEPMWRRARAVAGQPAPDFVLTDCDGHAVRLSDEWKKGPVVLVFTKDDCPCSMEAQPLFNQLSSGFRGKAEFLGVIDSPKHAASKYRDDFGVPYRMVLAGDNAVFKSFRAAQSVYTTLVGTDGIVVKQWPGYNRAMLQELDEKIASLVERPKVAIDTAMAPDKISSGCYFDLN